MSNIINESDDDSDSDIFDLNHYPEEYQILSEFVLSTLTGGLNAYVINKKTTHYDEYYDNYFKYCKTVENDSYITEFKENLNIDNDKFDKINILTKKIMDKFILNNKQLINKYIDDFNIESFNADIIRELLLLIHFNDLVDII